MKKILLSLAHMGGEEMKYIQQAFDTNWVVPLGPNVDGFENDLKTWLIKKSKNPLYVVALNSGTSAIHLSLVMLGIKEGDEVICQSFTFAASANPIEYQGAKPVFVDSERDTWNMDPASLKKAIVDRFAKTGKLPKAIIVAHLYGVPAKMKEITEIADEYGIPLVEDAAEAIGSEYNDTYCGTIGKYGILSFNGNKMITTSGGGALICHSEEESAKVRFYATQAREKFPYYQHEHIGYNYRLSNISAGIGRGQMEILDFHIAHRRMIHKEYIEQLKEFSGITVKNIISKIDINPNYWLSTILIDKNKTGFSCKDLSDYLAKSEIETRLLWKPLHLQPVFKNCYSYINGVSEEIFSKGLCLPSGPLVSKEDVNIIINKIKALSLMRCKSKLYT